MRVLVLGSSGFLGSNLLRHFASFDDFEVVGASRNMGHKSHRSLRDYGEVALDRLFEEICPDAVINCVGVVGHNVAAENPQTARAINVLLPGILAKLTSQRGIRMVHFSSDSVYSGNPAHAPFSEARVPKPFSLYGSQKLESERLVQTIDPEALILRVNFFGWSITGDRGMLDHFVSHAMAGTRPIGYVSYFASSLDTRTVALAVKKAIEQAVSGIYNLGSSDRLSKYQFGQRVLSALAMDPALVTPGEPSSWVGLGLKERDLTMSSQSISELLGISLPTQEEGIQLLIRDLKPFLRYFSLDNDDLRRNLQPNEVVK